LTTTAFDVTLALACRSLFRCFIDKLKSGAKALRNGKLTKSVTLNIDSSFGLQNTSRPTLRRTQRGLREQIYIDVSKDKFQIESKEEVVCGSVPNFD
jgi:hypothetical protein